MSDEAVLREMAADLAVIKSKVECLPKLVERIETLERTDIKRTAWAAGASACMSAVIAAVVWVLSSAGCAPLPAAVVIPEDPPSSWPTHVEVIVDAGLGEACVQSVLEGIQFWIDRGITKIDTIVLTENVSAALGYITVGLGAPDKPTFVASTTYQTLGPDMLWADVAFREGYCNSVIAAHELGHALGLDDLYVDRGNIMFWATQGQGLDVTPEQLEQIR